MCKVMILKGIENSPLALQFMKAVAPNMSIFNTDGIGYSAVNSKNELFSEKWHRNYQFMETETVIDQDTLTKLEPFKSRLPNLALNYKSYGQVTRDDLRTVTMHTRFATCGKGFENTHPFIDGGTSLIHNGVISNSDKLALNKISSCDSENALQLYNSMGLNLATDEDSFQKFSDKLKGYWAFAFLSKDTNGIYMLDVVREGAPLYWAMIPEIGEDCAVFATTKDIIEIGVKALGITTLPEINLLSETDYHRFNALNGELIFNHQIDDSVLNKPTYSYTQPTSKYVYNKETYKMELVAEPKKTEDSYEGYLNKKESKISAKQFRDEMLGINDEPELDDFYDTEVFLIDRLSSYDKLMVTELCSTFEDLPNGIKLFIERKEEEDYIDFDDVIEMLEAVSETDKINSLYDVYRKNKRA